MARPGKLPSIENLRSILDYSGETGVFTWRVTLCSRAVVGTRAGTSSGKYRAVSFNGRRYREHRLAWLYFYGVEPTGEIDHINGDHADNRIYNLRDVIPQLNKQNIRKANNDSKSGLLGAFPNGRNWRATLNLNGKSHYIGTYPTPEEAHAAYIEKKRQLHLGCTL